MKSNREKGKPKATKRDSSSPSESIARRDFFKRAAKAAGTAPAIALLVAATSRPAFAEYGRRDLNETNRGHRLGVRKDRVRGRNKR